MSERDRVFPNPGKYHPLIHEGDYDAPHDGLTPQQRELLKRRSSRTIWAAGGAGITIVLAVGGLVGYEITHQDEPRQEPSAAAPVKPGIISSSPSVSESAPESASPSPSKTSASPSPSLTSPSALPSSSASKTHRVVTPSPTFETPTPTPETTPPQACTWETSANGEVTVGECGDHTAYNDEQRTGAHQLPVGMMFGNVCMKGSLVAIHYGGGYDLVEDHGYFPIPGPC